MGQDEHDHPEVPDLDLPPVSRATPKANPPALVPAPAAPAVSAQQDSTSDDFGGLAIERGGGAPMASPTHQGSPKPIAIDVPARADFGFGGMEIERGGGSSFAPPTQAFSQAPASGRAGSVVSSGSSTSGLELAYQRADARRRPPYSGPPLAIRILAWALPLVVAIGAVAALVKVAHRPGRRVVGLLPRAFDASSTLQSGGVALVALVLAIGVGWTGAKARPRSWAMLASAATLLVTSLAMVTVTLVSTEENATADGALLIPYTVPAALSFLGLGIVGRGPTLFLGGGVRRAATVLIAALGGAFVFAGIELSALATRLP